MRKKWQLLIVPLLIIVLLMSCKFFTPDYIGKWEATVTAGAASIPVALEFTETTFSVTIDTIDPGTMAAVKYVFTGDLAESTTEGTLDATITGLSQNGTALDAANMAAFLTANTLNTAQTFTFVVDGETMTISASALLTALTGATSIDFTAAAT